MRTPVSRKTDGHTYRQAGRETDEQTDRQTEMFSFDEYSHSVYPLP